MRSRNPGLLKGRWGGGRGRPAAPFHRGRSNGREQLDRAQAVGHYRRGTGAAYPPDFAGIRAVREKLSRGGRYFRVAAISNLRRSDMPAGAAGGGQQRVRAVGGRKLDDRARSGAAGSRPTRSGRRARAGAAGRAVVGRREREVEREHVGLGALDDVPRHRAAEVQAPGGRDRAQRVPRALDARRCRTRAAPARRRRAARRDRAHASARTCSATFAASQAASSRASASASRRELRPALALQRAGERHGPGHLQLDDAVRRRRAIQLARAARPTRAGARGRGGRPAAAARVGAEPLGDHVAVQPRQLRAERDVVGRGDVRDGRLHVVVRQAADTGRRPRRQPSSTRSCARRPPGAAWAAATMLRQRRAATSSQPRVFSPQSGLTHSRSRPTRASASSSSRSISSIDGHPRRVDVVDARADLVRVVEIAGERVEHLHVRARRLDRDHVGVEAHDVLHDLVELRVAHVRVDLGVRPRRRDGQPEAVDGPADVVVLARARAAAGPRAAPPRRPGSRSSPRASRSTHLVLDRERDLRAGLAPRLVVAHERPLQDRHRAGQHALHRLLGERLRVAATSATVIGSGRETSP